MTGEIATQEQAATLAPPAPLSDDPTPEAPYGWMTDPNTGEKRPRKRPGRRSRAVKLPPPGKSPSLDELQAAGTLPEAADDTAPGAPPKGKRAPRQDPPLPPFRAGSISKGVNGLYRRAGRLIRMWDMEVGSAVIASTQKIDEDDLTVGEAWEQLAKTNPRIRAFLLKMLSGGAWTGLFTAHLPILLAVMMKDGIRRRIPLLDLAGALLTDEADEGAAGDEAGEPVPSGLAHMLGGIQPDDMAQMMAMAQGMMGQMAANVPRASNVPREPVPHPSADEVAQHHPAGE